MIVISTNNGVKFLTEHLNSYVQMNLHLPIAIIDTISTDEDAIQLLQTIKSKEEFASLNITVYQTPYRGFDSGAIIWAMKNIDADRFYFVQDSIVIKDIDFFKQVDEKLRHNVAVPILIFDGTYWDNMEQVNWSIEKAGSYDTDFGIFGPMFSILKTTSNRLVSLLDFYPETKNNQKAMERVWGVLFKKHGITIDALCGHFNYYLLMNDGYPLFKKYFPERE